MEGAASLSNDSCLSLDEISECRSSDIGTVVYAVANGVGKQRAGRSGHARPVVRWRTFVVSSGEQTIAESMARGGFTAMAGQEVRLLNIFVERKYGVWDDLGVFADGPAFTNAIRSASKKYYGVAGRAFLERLTRETDDLRANFEAIKIKFTSLIDSGQEDRAAARFALVGLAGELASKYGIVPWPQGAAIEAAMEMFKVWRQHRGKGNSEPRRICECVLDFINAHGDSRFSEHGGTTVGVVRERAGWWINCGNHRKYWFTTAAMSEALKGHNLDVALRVLREVGALPAVDVQGRGSQVKKIEGASRRIYEIDPDKLVSDEEGSL
jgi:putative DNA primase/helicase